MISQAQIIKILKENKQILTKKYDVKFLYLFGSLALNEGTKKSDVDLLVEFNNNSTGLLKFVNLKFFLEKILKSKVDLVTQDALVSWMRDSIHKEKIRVA